MEPKKSVKPLQLRKKAKDLITAALHAFEEPLANVAGFKSAGEFKEEILKSLELHPGFDRAARELHSSHAQVQWPGAAGTKGQVPASIRPHGRVQATRFDPPRGHESGKPRRNK